MPECNIAPRHYDGKRCALHVLFSIHGIAVRLIFITALDSISGSSIPRIVGIKGRFVNAKQLIGELIKFHCRQVIIVKYLNIQLNVTTYFEILARLLESSGRNNDSYM